MTASPAPALGPSIELEIGGMTCASCAMRIEKKLNKLDGVTATVNYATEKAQVRAPDGVDTEILIAEVAKAGYTASLPRNRDVIATGDASEEDQPDTELNVLRRRLVGSVAFLCLDIFLKWWLAPIWSDWLRALLGASAGLDAGGSV